jgi:hypothetical protein
MRTAPTTIALSEPAEAAPEREPRPGAADRIADWLLAQLTSDGHIIDSVHREPGTYVQGFAALVFALQAERTGDPKWLDGCRRSLAVAQRRPLTSEFDQLALLLLVTVAQSPTGEAARCKGSAVPHSRVPKLYRGRRLVSNNWVAMRALNFTLRAHLTGSDSDRREAARLWQRVLAWQLPNGLFSDAPGGEATPTSYHAKFCAMLALAEWADPEFAATELGSRCRDALRRGLDALLPLISPTGVLAPYGRSRNTLFGQAAAVFALRIGARLFESEDYSRAARLCEMRLAPFIQPDGHIPCVLNQGEVEKRDWDVYVNNPDYNAYAAALLLLAEILAPKRVLSNERATVSLEPGVREVTPLLVIRDAESYAVFVTHGQCVPLGTPFFADTRYYGMQPLYIERAGRCVFEAAPYTWKGESDRRSLFDPKSSGWIPWLDRGADRWCVRRFEKVRITPVEKGILVEAEGTPDLLRPLSRLERVLRSLIAAGLGKPSPIARSQVLAGVRLKRTLVWRPANSELGTETRIDGVLPSGVRFVSSADCFIADRTALTAQPREAAPSCSATRPASGRIS